MKWTTSFLLTLLFTACADTKPKKPEAKKIEGPKLVGKVASISPDKRFVLVQSYGKWDSAAGRILTTRGADNRSANLRVTGEKLGEFAAADIQSGLVETGDSAYSQHDPQTTAIPKAIQVDESLENKDSSSFFKNN